MTSKSIEVTLAAEILINVSGDLVTVAIEEKQVWINIKGE